MDIMVTGYPGTVLSNISPSLRGGGAGTVQPSPALAQCSTHSAFSCWPAGTPFQQAPSQEQ
eukprot:706105-Rhodomonas_salina.1